VPALDRTGLIIAIVDGFANPAIYQFLDNFDSRFGLTSSGPTLKTAVVAKRSKSNGCARDGRLQKVFQRLDSRPTG
jgi:hypothetical protein